MKTTLIVDADTIAVQVGAAVQVAIKWNDDIFSMFADGKEAWEQVQENVNDLQEQVASLLGDPIEDTEIVLAFSDPTRKYFRHKLLPSYKSNRQKREGTLRRIWPRSIPPTVSRVWKQMISWGSWQPMSS